MILYYDPMMRSLSINRYISMAREIRFEVTVCSTRDWNSSFSSMVITGSRPTIGSQILTVEVIGRGRPDFIGLRKSIASPLMGAPSAGIQGSQTGLRFSRPRGRQAVHRSG